MNILDEYLTQQEAAQFLTELGMQMDPSTLSKMGRAGVGPKYIRKGQAKFFHRMDLIAWFDEQQEDGPRFTNKGRHGLYTEAELNDWLKKQEDEE